MAINLNHIDNSVLIGATERLRINSSGQVSLGNNPTVAADAALHIELDGTREYLRLEGDVGTSNAYLEIEAPDNRRKAIIFKSGGTRRGVIGVGDSDEASATSLFFSASSNIAGNSPHMVIDSSGRLGIGGNGIGSGLGVFLRRSSPTTTNFYEASDGTKTMITGVDSTNDYVKIGSLSNHRVGIVANNGEKLSITTTGRLGLGYNNPDETNGGAGFITRATPVTRTQYYSPAGQYAGSFGLVSNTNTKMWIAVESSYAQGSAVSAGILLRAHHQDAGGSDCGYTIKNLRTGNALTFSSVKTAASTGSPAVETERLRISSSGEMGLGLTQDAPTGSFTMRLTETPEFNLYSTQHAQNNNCKINFGIGQSASVSGNTGARIEMNIPNTGGQMTGELKFHTNQGDNLLERLRIKSDGYVGINETNPTSRLVVDAGTTSNLTACQFKNDSTSAYATNDGGINNVLSLQSTGTNAAQSVGLQFSLDKSGETGCISEIGATRESNGNSTLVFRTRDSATGRNERLRIASSGLIYVNRDAVGGRIDATAGDGSMTFSDGNGRQTLKIKTMASGQSTAHVFDANGNLGIKVASPFSRIQSGGHTFNGGNGMHANSRVGMSNHGNLTGLMLASTYNDSSYPEYGLVFVQGPSTSSYNVWSISPDGPAKGNSLNLHYGAQNTNIHVPANRKFEFTGEGYFLSPNQVSFNAGIGAHATAASNYMVFTTAYHNVGGCYNTSNGIFTAPVAGVYIFTITGLYTLNTSSATWKLVWSVNNSNKGVAAEWQTGVFNNSYNTIGQSSIIYQLAANDTVRLQVHGSSFHVSGQQTRFCGHLLG